MAGRAGRSQERAAGGLSLADRDAVRLPSLGGAQQGTEKPKPTSRLRASKNRLESYKLGVGGGNGRGKKPDGNVGQLEGVDDPSSRNWLHVQTATSTIPISTTHSWVHPNPGKASSLHFPIKQPNRNMGVALETEPICNPVLLFVLLFDGSNITSPSEFCFEAMLTVWKYWEP